MGDEIIRQAAYRRWEADGRPEGQDDRHWFEAKRESEERDLPKTWSADDVGGFAPPDNSDQASAGANPSGKQRRSKSGKSAFRSTAFPCPLRQAQR